MTVCCLLHLYNLHLFCIYKTETSQNGKSSLVLKIILYLTLFWHPTTLTGKICLIWSYEINKHFRIQSTYYLYAKNLRRNFDFKYLPLKPHLFFKAHCIDPSSTPPRLPPGINPSAPFVANETKLEFLWTRRWEEVKQEGVYYYTIQVWEFDEQIPLIISGLLLRVKWDLLAFLELQDDDSFKNREMLNHITILYYT